MSSIKSKYGDDEDSIQPFFTTYNPRKGGTFKINLHGPIISPDQFVLAVQALDAASEEDVVEISLQSPGGNVCAADYFIHAMRKTEGHIHITATGDCSSAATFILLHADSFELSEHFTSTIHCGSLGSGGTFNEYKAQVAFYPNWMEKVARSMYEGFLDPEELDDMLEGKDIILDAKGWVERYNRRNEYFKAKEEAANKPARKPRKKKPVQIPDEN